MTTTVELSTIKPDFNDLVSQLQADLSTRPVWKDGLLRTSTGAAITEHIAGIGALDQYAIASALEEAMLTTAKNESSVYAWVIGQGIRLTRKLSASTTGRFVFPSPVTSQFVIPAYSVFKAQTGESLFNRDSLLVPAGTTTFDIVLYEGVVIDKTIQGIGSDYQVYITPEDSFSVSDSDLVVRINGTPIDVVTDRLWERKGLRKTAVWDRTTKTGQLWLLFGNDFFGAKPSANDLVNITYIITRGTSAATTSIVNSKLTLTLSGLPDYKATVITALNGGGDQTNAYTLQKTAPILWGAQGNAVNGTQYASLPIGQYPGVIDLKTYAQRNLSTRDLRYMNLVKLVLLTSTQWSPTERSDFETWYRRRSIYSTRFFFEEPIQNTANIEAEVYCSNVADLNAVRSKATAALQKLFEPRYRILGASFFLSDIDDAIRGCDATVKFIRIRQPTTDMFAGVVPPTNLSISSSPVSIGLPIGHYDYAVTATNAYGETTVTGLMSKTLSSTGVNTLNWTGYPTVTGFKVYGRTNNQLNLLTSLPSTQFTWTDDGTTVPDANVQLPTLDTTRVHYWSLGTVTLNMFYTGRDIL